MLRRISFALLAAAAVFMPGCGRQITPNPSTSDLAGKMVIRFKTNGPMNFQMYDYAIVIDACGGGTPYPNVALTTYKDYTYSFNVGGTFGVPSTVPTLLQYILVTNNLNPRTIVPDPSLTQLTLDYNGQNTEYELIFDRSQLDNPQQVTDPCPSSPTPTMQSTTWSINFFTIPLSNSPVLDSLGQGGGTDTTYNQAVIDTTQLSTTQVVKFTDITGPPSDPSAQIATGGEIDNYP